MIATVGVCGGQDVGDQLAGKFGPGGQAKMARS